MFWKGRVYYIGTQLEKNGKAHILNMAAKDAAVESIVADSAGLEITCRKQGKDILFCDELQRGRTEASGCICRKNRSFEGKCTDGNDDS